MFRNSIDSHETLQAIIDEVAHPIFVKDRDHRWTLVNESFCRLLGGSRESLLGKSDFDFVPGHQARVFWEKDNHVFTTGEGIDNEERINDSEGRERIIVTKKRLFVTTSGIPLLVGIISDITEYREAEARISHLANHDVLTELPNRAMLCKRLELALQQCESRKAQFVVLFFDLDRFKDVNDTLGHAIGDKLLRQVAERARKCLCENDLIARLGGDEFAILMPVANAAIEAETIARKINAAVAEPFHLDDHSVSIAASIGIAVAPGDGDDSGEILKNADLALYRSKASGGNTYCFFEPEMNRRMLARCEMERDLRKALAHNELELHYQPIVNLERGTIAGCEALLRWNHPTKGRIAPLDFIPLAEETGLIIPIGDWVLNQAAAEAATWPENVGVSVNLSVAQFKNADLVNSVVRALTRSGLAACRLELEVTESVMIGDSGAALTILNRLHAIGVRIALDDFGSGYSSLGYLRSFPFDKLKIDGSFVKKLGETDQSAIILRAIANLGSGLGMPTVAEGVETAEQLSCVRAEGCTEMQGYFFSPPCPASELRKLFDPAGALRKLLPQAKPDTRKRA